MGYETWQRRCPPRRFNDCTSVSFSRDTSETERERKREASVCVGLKVEATKIHLYFTFDHPKNNPQVRNWSTYYHIKSTPSRCLTRVPFFSDSEIAQFNVRQGFINFSQTRGATFAFSYRLADRMAQMKTNYRNVMATHKT